MAKTETLYVDYFVMAVLKNEDPDHATPIELFKASSPKNAKKLFEVFCSEYSRKVAIGKAKDEKFTERWFRKNEPNFYLAKVESGGLIPLDKKSFEDIDNEIKRYKELFISNFLG